MDRDTLAAMAMQALLTAYATNIYSCEKLAEEAYDMAFAMLAEREKRDKRHAETK
jgi:hypothetical protein